VNPEVSAHGVRLGVESILDPFVPLVRETVERHPDLPASVVYEMARCRG
jgi:hypothetical protein